MLGNGHDQQPIFFKDLAALGKGFFVIRDVFNHIKGKNNVELIRKRHTQNIHEVQLGITDTKRCMLQRFRIYIARAQ